MIGPEQEKLPPGNWSTKRRDEDRWSLSWLGGGGCTVKILLIENLSYFSMFHTIVWWPTIVDKALLGPRRENRSFGVDVDESPHITHFRHSGLVRTKNAVLPPFLSNEGGCLSTIIGHKAEIGSGNNRRPPGIFSNPQISLPFTGWRDFRR